MKTRLTPIASAVALALTGTLFAAQAQQTPAPPATDGGQVVEIVGIRASLESSIKQKRQADTRVEVITAEDIGKMPDKNVADSLQRVPGVTISSASANEGGFDENDRVSMRGTGPSLTQTLINGHNVASGEWFVLNQTGTVGRSVSYSLLPSELVSKVVVNKSSQASLVEGGVAGSVDIITRRPLDFSKPFTAEVSLGVVHASQPDKTDPQFSALLNWRNDAKTGGIMVQAFSEKRHLRRDGQELLGYSQIKAGSAIATAHPDLANVWYPNLIGSALFEQERERRGGLVTVELRPSKEVSLGLTGFVSKLDASNYNRNYMLWGSHVLAEGAGQSPDAGYVVRNGTLVSANFSPVAGTQYGVYDQIARPESSSSSNFVTLDGQWRASDELKVSGKLGTSSGSGKTPAQNVAEWNTGVGSGAGWGLNGINSAASWNLGTANNANPAGVGLGWIFGDQNVDVKDKESFFQADGDYAIGKGMLDGLKFGLRSASHERSSWGVIGQGPACKNSAGATVGFDWSQQYWCPVTSQSPADPANFPKGFSNYPGDFGSSLGGNFPRNVWQYSPEQLAAYNYYTDRNPLSRRDWNSEYGLKENSNAAYVQGDLRGDRWSGNVGLRYVRTTEKVTNNVAADATTPGAITTSAFGNFVQVTTEHSYSDLLPSLNLKYSIDNNTVARFAASRTMTRPDYSALAGVVSLSPPPAVGLEGSGSGGNPDLNPVRSNNLDANLEWYFAPRSLLSAGLFYMDLTSYVGYGIAKKTYKTFDQAHPAGYDAVYALSVPVNTSGSVKGFELAYEQPLGSNFGVQANYTYADGHEDSGKDLVGTSKNTYNLAGYFETSRFNARVAYNFRSKFYSGLDRSTAFYQADTASLAASLGYRFSDAFSISLDGMNLNNPKLKYYALNEDQPRSIYQNGRQYYLTLRAKM